MNTPEIGRSRLAKLRKELKMSGPGFRGYAYNADVYCVDCGQSIIDLICEEGLPFTSMDDPLSRDSNTIPQPLFFPESDHAEHCSNCHVYLYGEDVQS